MTSMKRIISALALLFVASATAWADGETAPARDPKQPVDPAYTEKIHKYTTQPYFTSPLVEYLPASKTVPTPHAACEGLLYWQDGRRPRDDCRGGLLGRKSEEPRRESRTPGEAGRSPHHQAG